MINFFLSILFLFTLTSTKAQESSTAESNSMGFKIWVWSDSSSIQIIDLKTKSSLIIDLYYSKDKYHLNEILVHEIGDVKALLSSTSFRAQSAGTKGIQHIINLISTENLKNMSLFGPTENYSNELNSNSVFSENTYTARQINSTKERNLYRWKQTLKKVFSATDPQKFYLKSAHLFCRSLFKQE